MAYTVFHLGSEDKIPSFDVVVCETEAELRSQLDAAFAERSYCTAIEVWEANTRLFIVPRVED